MNENKISFGGWAIISIIAFVIEHPVFVINSFYVFGIAPVILYKNGIIPASGLVLAAYWVTVVMSPLVTIVTLARWLTKYPSPLTWLQAAFGTTSVITLIYSYVTLKIVYGGEDAVSSSTIAALAAVITVISAFAIYLTMKALKNKFKN